MSQALPEFFLTGGSALAEYYLGHRRSEDLDLFTVDAAAVELSERMLRRVADDCGMMLRIVRTGPGFRRCVVESGDETIVLDLVHEMAVQIEPEKSSFGGIRVDTLREIAVNKVCAILGRSQTKDLVDLFFISRTTGIDPVELLPDASQKDGGLTPATLAYSLSQVSTKVPAGMIADLEEHDLRRFRDQLIDALTGHAWQDRKQ